MVHVDELGRSGGVDLVTATGQAIRDAAEYGCPCFVVVTVVPGSLDPLSFGVYPEIELGRLGALLRDSAQRRDGRSSTIVRVAYPDGAVDPANHVEVAALALSLADR